LAENQFRQTFSAKQRKTACRLAITNLLGWLGWLRAMETFSLQWIDVLYVDPQLGPTVGLPEDQGMVLLKLLAQTKSQQSMTADVVLAYSAASGFSIGKWFERRLRLEVQDEGMIPTDYILAFANGRPWTSHYFRHTFLYPFLETQRQLGDAYLQIYDGARQATASRNVSGPFIVTVEVLVPMFLGHVRLMCEAATPAEVMEYGRWRKSCGPMDMPILPISNGRLRIKLF
jgi:integrase